MSNVQRHGMVASARPLTLLLIASWLIAVLSESQHPISRWLFVSPIGGSLLEQTGVVTRLARETVSLTPSELTLFAGETRSFQATVTGAEDKTVTWAVNEENGGTITTAGLYTAPTIQGIYHVTAISKANPQRKAVARVTVLTYCDPPLQPQR